MVLYSRPFHYPRIEQGLKLGLDGCGPTSHLYVCWHDCVSHSLYPGQIAVYGGYESVHALDYLIVVAEFSFNNVPCRHIP